jgi:molybdopterin/thiamine biosynthesis adenylyltransferase
LTSDLESANWSDQFGSVTSSVDIRIDSDLWQVITSSVYDFSRREQAGVLFVRTRGSKRDRMVIGYDFLVVSDEYVIDHRLGLRYDGRFNLRVAERAESSNCGAILIHAHPTQSPPQPSERDATLGADFMRFMKRRQPEETHGLLVVGDKSVTGICDLTDGLRTVNRVVVAGIPLTILPSHSATAGSHDNGDRQLLAIGAEGQRALEDSTIAVIGISGGGSHVVQQLIHAGVGKLIVIDNDTVDGSNLRRLVGAVRSDVDNTKKIVIPARTAAAVRKSVEVEAIDDIFPSSRTINALMNADVIIGCVDNWGSRDALNNFALLNRVPYIDIGASVVVPSGGQAMRVGGQITLVSPDGPCLRCMGILTDKRVEANRKAKQGYSEEAVEPQVVSINGTLASEAVTTAMMLIAGDHRLERYRRYRYPPGSISVVSAERQIDCPACLAAGLN